MMTSTPPRTTGGDLFVQMLAKADPSGNKQAEVLVDTNVVVDFMSFGDLLREGDRHRGVVDVMQYGHFGGETSRRGAEAAWRSPLHRYRHLRARASILLMWVLTERRTVAAMLGKEMLDILEKVSPVAYSPRLLMVA